MYLLSTSLRDFILSAPELFEDLEFNYRLSTGQNPSDSEVKSWKYSLPKLGKALEKCEEQLGDCRVYCEYKMPSCSARADVIIIGLSREKYRSAVVIELKQWDSRSITINKDLLSVGGQTHLHPSEQALGYKDFLVDASFAFADIRNNVRSCSFLHNTLSNEIYQLKDSSFKKLCEISPLFSGDEENQLAEFVLNSIQYPPDSKFISEFDDGELRISKNLFNMVGTAVRNEPAWKLLDEQIIAYKTIMDIINLNDSKKHLVLVEGGPGTGKSVIAMQLFGELCREHIPTVHVTNSSCFTTVMQSLIQKNRDPLWGSSAVRSMFRLSHSWVKSPDKYRVAICDEAHRLRRKTSLYPYIISQRPQAEEIMENVNVFIAFLDEKQRLRKAEEGTKEYFRESAKAVGYDVIHPTISLHAQFRNAGSESFVVALDDLLYSERTTKLITDKFDFQVKDSVTELEDSLKTKVNEGYSSRIVAGFCWPWSDLDENGNLIPDVQIDEWKRPWNKKALPGRSYNSQEHPYTLWATNLSDPFSQIGCIYSVQGFEFDYVGVIWGNDLVWRGNRWIANPSASFDTEMRNRRSFTSSEIALPLLKNAYRVLTTRGLKGCFIYCTDDETKNRLKKMLNT